MRWFLGVAVLWFSLSCRQDRQPLPAAAPKVAASERSPPPAPPPAIALPTATVTPPSVEANAPKVDPLLRDELLALPTNQRGDRARATELHKHAMGELRRRLFSGATQTWAQAARADPSWDWPFYNLACLASLGGSLDDALAYLDAVRRRNPGPSMARRISRDRDLDPIRKRPELATLLTQLKAQDEPKPVVQVSDDEILEAAARLRADGQKQDLEALFPDRVVGPSSPPVDEKLQRRIRYALRSVAKAPIALRDLISVLRDDGGTDVFGLYQYSAYEECVRGFSSREEARAKCLGTRDDIHNLLRNNRNCLRYGLVYAHVAAPRPSSATPEAGGALTVTSLPWSSLLCELQSFPHYFVADLDRDGANELFVIATTAENYIHESRGEGQPPREDFSSKDDLAIFSAGRGRDHQSSLSFSSTDSEERYMSLGRSPREELYELHDLDRDGHLDLVHFHACDEESSNCQPWEERSRSVYLYESATDSWRQLLAP